MKRTIQKMSDGTYRRKVVDAITKVSGGDFNVTEKKKYEITKETSPTSEDIYSFSIIGENGRRYNSPQGGLTIEKAKDLLKKYVKREFKTNI